jgi:PKD repeat protein
MRKDIMKARILAAAVGVLLAACDGPTLAPAPVMQIGPMAAGSPPPGNDNPVARASVQKDNRIEGYLLAFNGAESTDANGDPLTYAWDFGDGGTGTGKRPAHAYADNGTYTVSLTVQDDRGGSGTTTFSLTINNANPTPGSLTVPTDVDEGNAFNLSLNSPTDRSTADQAAGFTYSFDCGSGVWSPWSLDASHECPGKASGVEEVRGRVQDKDGGIGVGQRVAILIQNVPPVIERAEAVRVGPMDYDVWVRFVDPPSIQAARITVNWGDTHNTTAGLDAAPGVNQKFGLKYLANNPGNNVTITVTVKDKYGASSTVTIPIQLQ